MGPGTTLAAFVLAGAVILAALTLASRNPSAELPQQTIEAASPCARAALQQQAEESPGRALVRADLEAVESQCARNGSNER